MIVARWRSADTPAQDAAAMRVREWTSELSFRVSKMSDSMSQGFVGRRA